LAIAVRVAKKSTEYRAQRNRLDRYCPADVWRDLETGLAVVTFDTGPADIPDSLLGFTVDLRKLQVIKCCLVVLGVSRGGWKVETFAPEEVDEAR
jgi:hypothetical protein